MMNIGDKVYIANESGVNTYIIDSIENDDVEIRYDSDDLDISTSFSLKEYKSGQLNCLFIDYDKAMDKSKLLQQEMKDRKIAWYDKILEEALNSVTLSEVENNGELLRVKRKYPKDNEKDILYYTAYLYLYEGKRYVIVYKYLKDSRKECIKFDEYDRS